MRLKASPALKGLMLLSTVAYARMSVFENVDCENNSKSRILVRHVVAVLYYILPCI